MKRKAVGIHVFAGGFTVGVQRVFDVAHQLEAHGFGLETAEAMCNLKCINDEEAKWPDVEGEFAFGNPRCTGFSTITSGYDETAHGPWSKQTCDIHQLCEYAAGRYDIVIWESVQQAYTVGKPLLDYLRDEIFGPKHYRVAHVFVNAGSFGNAQQRKRYFFVAYRDDRNFNVTPPTIDPYYATMYDAIYSLRERETKKWWPTDLDYEFDSYNELSADEEECIKRLPNGWCLNRMGRHAPEFLTPKYRFTWDTRTSDLPFSLHSVVRTNWLRPSPTLHSSASRFIHPHLDRPLTIGEISTIMGWPRIPIGKNPIGQIVKGIVPDVGQWLAEQALSYLNNEWGDDDFESSYNPITMTWEGRDTTGAIEKNFDLTKYVGSQFDMERYPSDVVEQVRNSRFNVALSNLRDLRERPTSRKSER